MDGRTGTPRPCACPHDFAMTPAIYRCAISCKHRKTASSCSSVHSLGASSDVDENTLDNCRSQRNAPPGPELRPGGPRGLVG
eukprot:357497-Chlamydomonas_euryale.AAC.2